jgi:hypothetical protein
MPAFALLKSGREVARQAGAMPAQAIRNLLRKAPGEKALLERGKGGAFQRLVKPVNCRSAGLRRFWPVCRRLSALGEEDLK